MLVPAHLIWNSLKRIEAMSFEIIKVAAVCKDFPLLTKMAESGIPILHQLED